MKPLSKNDLIPVAQKNGSTQAYSVKKHIDGVKIVELKQFVSEDGTFEEVVRLTETGALQQFPDFNLRQISRSTLLPGACKAWHFHLNQEDIWYIAPTHHMLLGLWDLRKDSKSQENFMRIVMGAGIAKLVYIPRGVAHGILNLGHKPGDILYLLNQQFDPSNPDEHRLQWDAAGQHFWQPVRG